MPWPEEPGTDILRVRAKACRPFRNNAQALDIVRAGRRSRDRDGDSACPRGAGVLAGCVCPPCGRRSLVLRQAGTRRAAAHCGAAPAHRPRSGRFWVGASRASRSAARSTSNATSGPCWVMSDRTWLCADASPPVALPLRCLPPNEHATAWRKSRCQCRARPARQQAR